MRDEIPLSDIDECSLGRDDCHPDADCINLLGTFLCVCQPGYDGDGLVCRGQKSLNALNVATHTCTYVAT